MAYNKKTNELKLDGKPYPKQIEFFQARNKYIAYGGARGGGKSWAMRRKFVLLCLKYPGIQILLLRRTFTELNENHIIPLSKELGDLVNYREKYKEFLFPNGSRIKMGYCDNEKDVLQYQGQAYDIIGMEEATQFTEFQFQALMESNRASGQMKEAFTPRMYFTCNPGGVGHKWIKRLFIDRIYQNNEKPDDYFFIPAFVWENEYLMTVNPEYKENLENLPENRKRAMLYGDWNVFAGQFFSEFRNNPEGYKTRKETHVIEPFEIPEHWKRFRSFDFGYSRPFSVGWWAMDDDGVLYRYRELYGCTGEPNTGVRWTDTKIATEIREIEETLEPKGIYIRGIADPAIFQKNSTGQSIADNMQKEGVYFEPGDNARLAGWIQMHNRMAFDENGYSMLYVFNTCKDFIRTIPELLHSNLKPEDLDTEGEDHIADESRYCCMNVRIDKREVRVNLEIKHNPLSSNRKVENNGFGFMRA